MKWYLDDTKYKKKLVGNRLMSPMISLKRYLHEKFFLLYLVCGEDSSRIAIFSAVAELPTKDVDS